MRINESITSPESPKSAVEIFHALNANGVDEKGIRIPHLVMRFGDKFDVHALALDNAHQFYVHVARQLIGKRPDELVFGIDRWTKPGQGVRTKGCLSVSHWNGEAWGFGVIAYVFDPPMFDVIDWHNPHWSAALQAEMLSNWSSISNAPHREPSPAMALPLRVVGDKPAATIAPAAFDKTTIVLRGSSCGG